GAGTLDRRRAGRRERGERAGATLARRDGKDGGSPSGYHRPPGRHRGARDGRLCRRLALAAERRSQGAGGAALRMKAALIWDPSFTRYRFRADHPFNPKRLELAISLIEELGLVDGERFRRVVPREATDEELLRVHSPEYIEMVKRVSEPGAER